MPIQLLRARGRAFPSQVRGRGKRADPVRRQMARDQAGIREIAHADGDIDALGNEVGHLVADAQVDREGGMPRAK
ncbi:hypothetical protein D3C86_2063500 [compost metagenome]